MTIYPDLESLSNAAAELIAAAANEAVKARGSFSIVLSGGSTPRRTYELLAGPFAVRVPWARTQVFFSDERCVPPTDSRNNYAMARDALLSRVPLPPEQVHAMPTEGGTPDELAALHDADLRSHFAQSAARDEGPAFDLALMGMGADGHTGSLFPGDKSLKESERWVVAVRAPASAPVTDRLTLTLPAINAARRAVFLVAGSDKRSRVKRVLRPDAAAAEQPLPAALVRGIHSTEWLVDSAAVAGLDLDLVR